MAAAPPTKEQTGAALEQAGQYANSPNVWTPENAPDVGLDPSKGFIARGTPIAPTTPAQPIPYSPAQPSPLPEPPRGLSTAPEVQIEEPKKVEQPKKGLSTAPEVEVQQPKETEQPKKGLSSAPEVQVEQSPQAQQPSPPPATLPTPTGPVVPTDAETEQETKAAEVQAHIKAGKKPGEAQAIVNGQEPKTLAGKTSEAAPPPQQPTEQPQGESVNWGDHGFQSFEQYQAFLDASGSGQKAVRGSGTTATLVLAEQADTGKEKTPSQQPAAPEAHVETPQKVQGGNVQGTSTIFGLNYDRSIDTQDNGVGAFGGVNTRNPNLKAVAVPVDILEATFGHFAQRNTQGTYDLLDTPEARAVVKAIRSAHVEVLGDDGKIHQFPIVDLQGSVKGHPGKVLDFTYGATREMGWNDNHKVSYQIVGGDGKPYAIDASMLTGGGGSGAGDGGGAGGGGAGGAPGAIGFMPIIPTHLPSGSERPSGQNELPGPSGGGGGGVARGGQGEQAGLDLSNVAAGVTAAALGRMFGGRGGGRAAPQPEGEEEEPAVPRLPYQSAMKQANVLGVKTLPPPPAPSGALPELGSKPLALPPPAPSAPPIQIDQSIVKGLIKRGFTRQQAEAFAAKASVSKPGAGVGGASFRPSAQVSAKGVPPPSAPGGPSAPPAPPSKGGAPPPPPAPGRQPSQQPQPFGAPQGSTFGVPKPPGSEALEGLPLAQAAKQHAAILSPDDPRVKKQADGRIKGEHFVSGDPLHEQLLAGLPYGQQGRQRQIVAQAEEAIANKTPFHISYISSPKEAELYPTRESRRIQYEKHSPEERLMGTTEGQLVGHSMIPVSVGITPSRIASEPHESVIHGISTNVLANNFGHVNRKLAEMGHKSPYEKLGTKFINDLEGYLSNLNAGHTGTGHGHAVGTAEYPNAPDENHVPYHLTRREADFINTVINNTAAFAKHEDGQALRRLAEANGTLITPDGETNRLRHQIEEHTPGWTGVRKVEGGKRVLEPTIRSFNTGLIHDVHPTEEHMPATIRPGKEYQGVTGAIHRTSQRGRPDVGVATSPRSQSTATARRDLAQNKQINEIEREFSEDRITEEEARHRLVAIGENPEEYRFVGGSGGLITPYEEDPESVSSEEHHRLKTNLREQWLSGKLDAENYRRRAAEVPLPTKPSQPASATSTQETAAPTVAKPKAAKAPASAEKPEEGPELPAVKKPTEGKVSDYLASHPVLEKHPWAKDVAVKIKPDMNPMGRFIEGDGPDTHEIHLKDPSYIETLKHELVHLGQAAEDKPRGGSATTAWTGTRRAATLAYAKKLFEDMKTPRALEDYAKAAGFDSPEEAHESYHKEYLPGFKGRENLDRLWRLAQEGAGHHMYHSSAGEREARGETPEEPAHAPESIKKEKSVKEPDMPMHESGHPMPRSPRHALTLPPGTHFKDPEGNIRMVPHEKKD